MAIIYFPLPPQKSSIVSGVRFGHIVAWRILVSRKDNGRMLTGGSLYICCRHGTGRQQQGREKFGERRSGRPGPENRLKCHGRRRRLGLVLK
jgi:hypothetical protein